MLHNISGKPQWEIDCEKDDARIPQNIWDKFNDFFGIDVTPNHLLMGYLGALSRNFNITFQGQIEYISPDFYNNQSGDVILSINGHYFSIIFECLIDGYLVRPARHRYYNKQFCNKYDYEEAVLVFENKGARYFPYVVGEQFLFSPHTLNPIKISAQATSKMSDWDLFNLAFNSIVKPVESRLSRLAGLLVPTPYQRSGNIFFYGNPHKTIAIRINGKIPQGEVIIDSVREIYNVTIKPNNGTTLLRGQCIAFAAIDNSFSSKKRLEDFKKWNSLEDIRTSQAYEKGEDILSPYEYIRML